MPLLGMRALVVDDDQSMHQLLRDLFRFWGCESIEVAFNGEEGVEKYRRLRPHLVLMDLDMPTMNGFDASKIIAQMDPHAAIILATGVPDSGLARKALEKGFVKITIPKPFHFDQLEMAIHEALKKAGAPAVEPARKGAVA
jgi:two-component system chemotaxis response regulator CheY